MRIILSVCSIFLLVAIADLPIGYYTFLRIVVTIGAVAVVVTEFNKNLNLWIIIFGVIAVLFNPLQPIYLYDKTLWIVIDLVTAALFGIKAITSKDTNPN